MTPREMLARLVAFDTVSSRPNLECVEFIAAFLAEHGVQVNRIPHGDGTKANLFATIGPNVPGGVILSGHTDVVPVEGQAWSSDPFTLSERHGRLYGRGTTDMKGFVALILALVPTMKQLKRPIHLALSCDEEVGCQGAPAMIAAMARQLPPVAAVIVGEPSLMQPVTAHKSITVLATQVTGHEAHSSQTHRGASAVMIAAELIHWLNQRAEEYRHRPSNLAFTPPYTTVHVGLINGGTAENIMAKRCHFTWDLRTIPEDDPKQIIAAFESYCRDSVLPPLQQRLPAVAIETHTITDVPALAHRPDSYAAELVRHLTGSNGDYQVAYAAEAGQFQEAGFDAVICGPGSIDQAHQADEYITLDQFEAGEAFIRRLIETLSR